jgi:regulator of protease activity HflC (stomatin/prohibitin superfamily)
MPSDPHPAHGAHAAVEQAVGLAFRFLFAGLAVLAVVWLLSGMRQIEAGSRAVVLRFGRVARVADAGLTWAWPRPIEEVVPLPGPEQPLTQEVAVLDRRGQAEVLDMREAGYLLTGDGGVLHLGGVITYHVVDVAAYLSAHERLAPALERAFCAATIAAAAGRRLDGVLAARAADPSDLGDAEAREHLRGDIRTAMNTRLAAFACGIEVSRIDLAAALPQVAKPAFDTVLSAEASAASAIADARTQAERVRQDGETDRTRIVQEAVGTRKELVARAHVDTDRIVALAAEASPERRQSLLARLYRERMAVLLHKIGTAVTLVDGHAPVRVLVPAESP